MKTAPVQNRYNTRIACISRVREAYIVYHGHRVGILAEESNDAGETDWVIRIDWDTWEKAGEPIIPGIDTDLRLNEYVRSYVPVIVEQRTPPEGREDIPWWLEKLGMEYYDRFEFMCRQGGECGNNRLLIERKE